MKSKALVLLSGGQDSVTCLFWAKQNFNHVEAIGFDYGQRHDIELKQAKKIADIAQVRYSIFNVRGIFLNSALVNHEQDVSGQHHRNKELPASFTAGRNMVFLSVVAGYAYDNKINNIVTGTCQTDYSGYPDCRMVFIKSMEDALNHALGLENHNDKIRIHTPLMYLTKAETWKLAKDISTNETNVLEVVREHSHTDYNGDHTTWNEWGYGKLDNPASILRAKGYEEAKEKNWI